MYVFEIGSVVNYFHFHFFSGNRGPLRGPRLMSRSAYRGCGEHSFHSVSEPRQFMNITELFENSFVYVNPILLYSCCPPYKHFH